MYPANPSLINPSLPLLFLLHSSVRSRRRREWEENSRGEKKRYVSGRGVERRRRGIGAAPLLSRHTGAKRTDLDL